MPLPATANRLPVDLDSLGVSVSALVRRHSGAETVDLKTVPLPALKILAGDLQVTGVLTESPGEGRAAATASIEWTAMAPAAEVSAGVEVSLARWSERDHLLVPGGLYAGNRFPVRAVGYCPCIPEGDVSAKSDAPELITSVSRLEFEDGRASRVQLKAGDTASPVVAVFFADRRAGLLLELPLQDGVGRETGIEIVERADRSSIVVRFTTPGVRSCRYSGMTDQAESHDRGVDLSRGQSLSLSVRLTAFEAEDLHAVYDRLLDRQVRVLPTPKPSVPLSAAFGILEHKYNRDNWSEDLGLYLSDTNLESHAAYQNGWCGGLQSTAPLLEFGDEQTRRRVISSVDVAFSNVSASGLLMANWNPRLGWTADFATFYPRYAIGWTLVRRHADVLFHGVRKWNLLRDQAGGPPERWRKPLLRMAGVLADVYHRNGEFGLWLDQQTGGIVVGGSASGALLPAALAMAGRTFGDESLVTTATKAGRSLYQRFTARGVTNGGPGDALYCPDSESAAALLESFVTLWELTGDTDFLAMARHAAAQAASWVVSYDYPFPLTSEFGRLGLGSAGAVFANVQNKHGAPGFCTLSGSAFLRLSRATGDDRYARVLAAVARALPQYLSRADRPIHAPDGRPLPPGWMNERVNTSDWDNNLGGVFYGSCWCEVSTMLTYADLPGVWVRSRPGQSPEVLSFDSIDAAWDPIRGLKLHNPTGFDAETRVLFDDGSHALAPAWDDLLRDATVIARVPARSTVHLASPRTPSPFAAVPG